MHAAVNRPGPNGIFPLFQPLIFRGCCWFVGEYYSPIILVQLLPSDTLIPHIEVMFLPLKRSRIKLTRKNLARVPWPKHRPLSRRLMGFWQRVPDETEAVDFLCWIFGLGWVGLVCLVGWLFSAVIFLFCFGRPGRIRLIRCVKPCVGPQGFSPLPLQTLCLSWSPNSWVFVTPPKTVKLGEWPCFFSFRKVANLGKSWVFCPLYPKEPH